MATVIITYEAKCKHCIFFRYKSILKKNGEKSKKMQAYCDNKKAKYFNENLTLKSKACNDIEL
jgi:hypothetical protein